MPFQRQWATQLIFHDPAIMVTKRPFVFLAGTQRPLSEINYITSAISAPRRETLIPASILKLEQSLNLITIFNQSYINYFGLDLHLDNINFSRYFGYDDFSLHFIEIIKREWIQ